MNASDFTQGMSHASAMSHSLGSQGLNGESAIRNFWSTWRGLSSRPDWDGYLTKTEADAWWQAGSGQALYVNEASLSLFPVTTASFHNQVGSIIAVNFGILNLPGMTDTGNVYGTLDLTLRSADGNVSIGYQTANVSPHGLVLDYYNFEPHQGEAFRNVLTTIGTPTGTGRDFDIHGYGHGQVRVVNPFH